MKFHCSHSQVHSSAAIRISLECAGPQQHNGIVPCLYVAPFLRYSCLPQNSPEILSLLSWTAHTGANWGKQLYLRYGAMYKHGICTIMLLRTCTFQWYLYCSTRVYLIVSSPNYNEISQQPLGLISETENERTPGIIYAYCMVLL